LSSLFIIFNLHHDGIIYSGNDSGLKNSIHGVPGTFKSNLMRYRHLEHCHGVMWMKVETKAVLPMTAVKQAVFKCKNYTKFS
jgi:hypothetical protein